MEQLPTKIGRYVIQSLIGVGGMGQIYKADDPVLRRTVAIKLISTKLMSGTDRAYYIRRFTREAEAAARCSHPNIIAVYDFSLHEGEPFLAMEFVPGKSIRQLLDDAPVMPVADAISVMLQVLEALGSAHEQGVIHQDIKPGNIMLGAENRVKVGDFGISRLMNMETTTVFSTLGTPAYMSPEQCRGEDVDGRSDLFSVGATLFEMVAGERAFQGRNATEISHRIQNDSLPLLPAQVRGEAPRLQLVLERAMAKHAEDRFDTSTDMAEALRQVLRDAPADETRIVPNAPAPRSEVRDNSVAPRPGPPFDPSSLKAVEEKLQAHVGPIARAMVRTVAGRVDTIAALCSELALSLTDEAERQQFLRSVASFVGARSPPPITASSLGESRDRAHHLPERELECLETTLADYVGPIARILVRRAAVKGLSIDSLWQDLASHITSPAERAAFLRKRPR